MTADLTRTARATGAFYLALAISGVLGILVARDAIYVSGDAAATVANLVENETLARTGIAAEMATVVTQALAALWFYRLFRGVNSFAAGSLAAFGFVNVIVGLVGAAFTATGLAAALGDVPAPGGDQAVTALLMYELNGATWSVGELFFGLWLIPMGYLVVKSAYMPRTLGYLLVVGGLAYVINAYLTFLWPDAPGFVSDGLPYVASVGEFWIIGYLLIIGVRRSASEPSTLTAEAA